MSTQPSKTEATDWARGPSEGGATNAEFFEARSAIRQNEQGASVWQFVASGLQLVKLSHFAT